MAAAAPAKHTQAVRLFGYDVFISFALGAAPRGTQSYASDLARRLREQDFAVFFSDDQAPPGVHLDSTLQRALLRSRALVVVANRGTLQDPRWVRTEVETFRQRHPGRPVVPISIDGALQDAELGAAVQPWLAHGDKIWLDETAQALAEGLASDAVVERLATTPRFKQANVRWRWTVRAAFALLATLALGLAVATLRVIDSNHSLQAALQRATVQRLGEGSLAMLSGQLAGTDERTLQQLVAAYRLLPAGDRTGTTDHSTGDTTNGNTNADVSADISADADRWLLTGLVARESLQTLRPTTAPLKVPRGAGHQRNVALAAGGKHFAVLTEDSFQIWRTDTGAPVAPAPAGAGANAADRVTALAFSPDGNTLTTGHQSGALRRWSVRTGGAIGTPWVSRAAAGDAVSAVAYSASGRWLAAAGQSTLQLWELGPGKPGAEPEDDQPTGTTVALASGPVRAGVMAIAIDEAKALIVTGHLSGLLRVWSARTRAWVNLAEAGVQHNAPVNSLALSADGSRVASGGEDGVALLFSARSLGPPLARLVGHRGGVVQVAFSPDGTRVLSASSDQTLRLWNAENGAPAGEPLEGHKGAVHAATFSADGRHIVSVGADDTVRVWDAGAGALAQDGGVQRTLVPAAFSADGKLGVAVSAIDPGALQRWGGAGGAGGTPTDPPIPTQQGGITSLALSADGSRIATGGADGSLRLWNAATGAPLLAPLRGHIGAVRSVAFSTDGTRLASGGEDGSVRLWATASATAVNTPLAGHTGAVHSVAFSPDGKRLASGGAADRVRLWDVAQHKALPEPLSGPAGDVSHVAFSPDGTRIAAVGVELVPGTGAGDPTGRATLRLWDARSLAAVGGPWAGNETAAQHFAFSPDSRRIAASGVEASALAHPQDPRGHTATLRFWDARSGAFIGARPLHGITRMFTAAFSADGLQLTVGDAAGHLVQRPAPTAWPGEMCSKLTRNMSPSEWRDWVSPDTPYRLQCAGLPIAADPPTAAAPAARAVSR